MRVSPATLRKLASKSGALIVSSAAMMTNVAQMPGIVHWQKYSLGAFTDNALTIACAADNDVIGGVYDLSTLNNHGLQATTGNKPLYRTNVLNGKAVAEFNGSRALQATFGTAVNMPLTVIMLAKTAVDTNRMWYDGLDSTHRFGYWIVPGSNVNQFISGTSTTNNIAITSANYSNTWNVHVAVWDGNALGRCYIDTTDFVIPTITATQMNGFTTGSNYLFASGISGQVFEVIVFARRLNMREIQNVMTYLYSEAALPNKQFPTTMSIDFTGKADNASALPRADTGQLINPSSCQVLSGRMIRSAVGGNAYAYFYMPNSVTYMEHVFAFDNSTGSGDAANATIASTADYNASINNVAWHATSTTLGGGVQIRLGSVLVFPYIATWTYGATLAKDNTTLYRMVAVLNGNKGDFVVTRVSDGAVMGGAYGVQHEAFRAFNGVTQFFETNWTATNARSSTKYVECRCAPFYA